MSSLSPKRRSAASATTRPPPPPTFAHLRPVLRGYTTDTDRLIHGWLCGDRERSRRLVPRVLCAGLRAASFVDGALQHGLDVVPLALVGRVATIRVEEADDRRDVSPTVERVPGDVLPPTSEQLGRVQAVVEQIDRQSPTTPHPASAPPRQQLAPHSPQLYCAGGRFGVGGSVDAPVASAASSRSRTIPAGVLCFSGSASSELDW